MERRRAKRKRLRIRVQVEPGTVATFTGDLTPTGVFLYSARVHAPGTPVRIVLRLPQGPAEARGVVRWAKRVPSALLSHVRGGMGVEFTWISAELAAFLGETAPSVRAAS